MEKLSYR